MVGFFCVGWVWNHCSSWWWGVRRLAVAHTKKRISSMTFISKEVGASRHVDYCRVLDSMATDQGMKPVGTESSAHLKTLEQMEIMKGKITWESVEAEDNRVINVPENAVYFLHYNKIPFLAQISKANQQGRYDFEHEGTMSTGKGITLQVCATGLEQGNEILQWLNSQISQHSVFREKMIVVASPQDGTTGQTIQIIHRPEQAAEQIVLPDSITSTVDRLIHSRIQHQESLKRYGQEPKIGLLFHGPPGTGKTLLIRQIISECKKHTVIVPNDMAVETLREAFRLGQYLQPSIMVLEDVDLLAPHRENTRTVDGLQELMNQLDGLNPVNETIILMSTNRPEVLEPALASRPGRISQAIEFPLPDDAARAKLFENFLSKVESNFDTGAWSARTKGASPAFILELCKRATLIAIEQAAEPVNAVEIRDQHLDAAIEELVVSGGVLTSRALGFPEPGS